MFIIHIFRTILKHFVQVLVSVKPN